jgi:4-carboxymuconolactone decarboxylase
MRHHEKTAFVIASVISVVLGCAVVAPAQDRLPPIPADRMTAEQKQAVADFKAARGAELSGPFHPLLRSPEVMTRARAMGDYLRYNSALPPRLSEFVILLTASQWAQQYEWAVHHPIALKEGVSPETATAIAEGRRPERMTEDEATLYDLCLELQRNHAVSDATYARALARFGERGVVDTVGIVGYYTLLAMTLNTFQTPAPAGATPAPFKK